MAQVQDDDRLASNLAAWLMGKREIRVKEFPLPNLGPSDVRVQMKCVGICGSDVHYFQHLQCAGYEVKEPMVLGHESAGVVLEVGPAVTRVKPGDRVALEPGGGCRTCDQCKGGRYNLCPRMRFFATPPVHGSLAHQVVHPEDLCFVLPGEVSLEEGAMCEPLSVAVHACRRAGQLAGLNVAVMGAGPIGLLTFKTAKAMGASRAVVLDVSRERLEMAEALGADGCVPVQDPEDPVACARAVHEALGDGAGPGVGVVLDCVGRGSTMRAALATVASGGRVVLVGMAEDSMALPLTAAAAREVDILGSFRYCNDYACAIDLLRTKRVNVMPLVTHRFPFSQQGVEEAYTTSERGGRAVKVMIML